MTEQFKHFMVYATGTLINILVSYSVLMLLTNTLSKPDFAFYGFLNSLFSLLLIVFNFGVKESLFKLSSTNSKSQLLTTVSWFFSWQLFLCSASVFVALFDVQLALIAFSFLAMSWLLVNNGINRGAGHYFMDALAIPMHRILWLVACIVLFKLLERPSDYALPFYASLIATLLVLLIVRNRQYLTIDTLRCRLVKPPGLLIKFFLVELSVVAYTKIDMLLLRLFGVSQDSAADYYFSVQLFDAAVYILAPISYFFFNQFAKQNRIQRRSLDSSRSYALLMIAIVCAGHIIWLTTGEVLISWFFPQYKNSFELVALFLFALYPVAVNYILSSVLILSDRELPYAKACGMGFFAYVGMSFLLIPLYSTQGAIYCRIASEVIIASFLLISSSKLYRSTLG